MQQLQKVIYNADADAEMYPREVPQYHVQAPSLQWNDCLCTLRPNPNLQ